MYKQMIAFAAVVGLVFVLAPATRAEVLHYTFDNPDDLGNDSSSNGNHGTVAVTTNPLTQTAGKFGAGAAAFSFVNDAQDNTGTVWPWIQLPDLYPSFPTGDATLSVWLKDHSTDGQDVTWNLGSGSANHYTWADSGLGFWNTFRTERFDAVDYNALPGGPWDYTDWHHIAITNDISNNQYTVYFDGQVAGQTTTTGFHLGAQRLGWGSDNRYFDGSMDELRLYDEVLTGDQIQSLIQSNVIPEPSTALLGIVGVLCCLLWRRRIAR